MSGDDFWFRLNFSFGRHFVTAALLADAALAGLIGAGAVDWSYWWALVPAAPVVGAPATWLLGWTVMAIITPYAWLFEVGKKVVAQIYKMLSR